MCDYSKHGLPSRLAREGEHLVTHRFRTQRIGLASALEIEEAESRNDEAPKGHWFSAMKRWFAQAAGTRTILAVCIPPGARLRMTEIPVELRSKWALRNVEIVWFTQIGDLERHRDAIRFGNGKLVELQTLPEHLRFMVLSLGPDESPTYIRMPIWPDELRSVIGVHAL
jgi:hypothetical protein